MPGWDFKSDSHWSPVTFRSPRNWTAIAFFSALASLHVSMATTSFMASRYEAHMSVVFGAIFSGVALACLLSRREITIDPQLQQILVRTGFKGVAHHRATPFASVTLVRVTLLGRNNRESSVVIVCEQDDIELPPTSTPRQEGLLLAMIMGVRLVKVYGDGPPPEPAQRIARLYRNEDAI